MITAHLPSGYVLARSQGWSGAVLVAAVIGAVFPDVDLIAFYLIDDRAVHHHRYWLHAPAFALFVSAALYTVAALAAPKWTAPVLAFGAAWTLHILLDSVAGGIMWLWPVSTELHMLFPVAPRHGVHFLVAFLTHWTMIFEALIWLAAIWFWRKARSDV